MNQADAATINQPGCHSHDRLTVIKRGGCKDAVKLSVLKYCELVSTISYNIQKLGFPDSSKQVRSWRTNPLQNPGPCPMPWSYWSNWVHPIVLGSTQWVHIPESSQNCATPLCPEGSPVVIHALLVLKYPSVAQPISLTNSQTNLVYLSCKCTWNAVSEFFDMVVSYI